MKLLAVKILSSGAIFLSAVLCGLLPIKIVEFAGKHHARIAICYMNCLAGGIFLGTSLLHMLPEVRGNMFAAIDKMRSNETDGVDSNEMLLEYPLPELILGIGFFLVFFMEEFVLAMYGRRHGHGLLKGNPALRSRHTSRTLEENQPLLCSDRSHFSHTSCNKCEEEIAEIQLEECKQCDECVPCGENEETRLSCNLPQTGEVTLSVPAPHHCGDVKTCGIFDGHDKTCDDADIYTDGNHAKTCSAVDDCVETRDVDGHHPKTYGAIDGHGASAEHVKTYGAIDVHFVESGNSRAAPHSSEFFSQHTVDEMCNDHAKEKLRVLTLLLSLSLHTVFEGLAMGIMDSDSGVLGLFTAVIIHKSVISFSMGMQFLHTYYSIRQIVVFILLFSGMTILGAAVGILLTETGISVNDMAVVVLEGLTTGTFIYVTFFEVIHKEMGNSFPGLIKVLMIFTGFGVIAILSCFDWYRQ